MFGIRYKTGSTLNIRELGVLYDRQGLFHGKSESLRQSTHLQKAGSAFCRIAAQADYLLQVKRTVTRPFIFLSKFIDCGLQTRNRSILS